MSGPTIYLDLTVDCHSSRLWTFFGPNSYSRSFNNITGNKTMLHKYAGSQLRSLQVGWEIPFWSRTDAHLVAAPFVMRPLARISQPFFVGAGRARCQNSVSTRIAIGVAQKRVCEVEMENGSCPHSHLEITRIHTFSYEVGMGR